MHDTLVELSEKTRAPRIIYIGLVSWWYGHATNIDPQMVDLSTSYMGIGGKMLR